LFVFSIIIFLGSLGWLYSDPDWEPAIVAISSLASVIFNESHVKLYFSEKIRTLRAKKIPIENGTITISDAELLDIVRPLCLGENKSYKFEDRDYKRLEKYARKSIKDKNQKFYVLSQVNSSNSKLGLIDSGLEKIVYLYNKRFLNVTIDCVPKIIKNFVNIVYSSPTGHPSFSQKTKPFDVYSNNVTDGQIHFVADIPETIVKQILEKLNISSTQQLALPYHYSLLDLPDIAVYEYVVPAQVFAALTRFKGLGSDDQFWAIQNWAFGPH